MEEEWFGDGAVAHGEKKGGRGWPTTPEKVLWGRLDPSTDATARAKKLESSAARLFEYAV